jgi:hypothetical protein
VVTGDLPAGVPVSFEMTSSGRPRSCNRATTVERIAFIDGTGPPSVRARGTLISRT